MAIKRVGKQKGNDSERPVLITFSRTEERNKVIEAAKNTKFQNSCTLKKIRVKKDVHPGIRKEWKRLTEVYEEESKKPENAGHTIEFDKKRRVILRDNMILDRFMPHF